MKKWFRQNPGMVIIILVSIFIIIVSIVNVILILANNSGLSNAFVAFGTGVLAIATGFLALFTWQSVKNAAENEKQERRERLLDEIISWAEAVANSAIARQTKNPSEIWKTKLEYKKHRTKGKLIKQLILSSFKELSGYFDDIELSLDKTIMYTEQIESGKGNIDSLKFYESAIAAAVEKLFEEAATLKTKNII
jgi:ABC-type transport system involved in cytochrome bd biosynthesis fused ATPase/permease subunit